MQSPLLQGIPPDFSTLQRGKMILKPDFDTSQIHESRKRIQIK